MNNRQWIESTIKSKNITSIPIMTNPGIELVGMTVLDAVKNGESHFKAIEALADRYPQFGASTVIMDLTVEAEAFGSELVFSEDEVPSVVGRLVSGMEEIRNLKVPSIDTARVPEYLKANRLAAENIDKPVFSGCIGPFSLAGRLYDMTEIMMGIYTEPDAIRLLLDKCTEFILEYCKALKATGTAGVVLAEPAAGLLPDEDCREFSSVYVKKIVDAVQDDNFLVILHNCGNGGHCTPAMVYTGARAYHFGNRIDMCDALEGCPKDVLVMGNLDPVGVFKNYTPEQVYEATTKLLEKTRNYDNFVISTGCDVPPAVPFANIDAYCRAVEDFNSTIQ